MQGETRKAGAFDRFLAAVLTVAVATSWVPVTIAEAAEMAGPAMAEIRGSVLAADGLTAIAGVSVKAANMVTRQVFTSAPTEKSGTYTLRDLPAGSYDLAVDTPQGLYAADLLVDVAAGKRATVSLALRPSAQPAGQEEPPKGDDKKPEEGAKGDDQGEKGEKKDEPPAQPEPEQQKKKKKGPGFWRSPGGAAIAIVVGAAIVGAAANSAAGNDDNSEDPMTQSSTSNSPN